VKQKLIKMEKQILEMPILQTSKEIKNPVSKNQSSCCIKPANASSCCTPSKTKEENNGNCCDQPADGSACCDK
jgi:hypothetical protein